MDRNFVVTLKEGGPDDPFFLVFENYDNIGLGGKVVTLFLRPGISLEEANEMARRLNTDVMKLSVVKFGA